MLEVHQPEIAGGTDVIIYVKRSNTFMQGAVCRSSLQAHFPNLG